MDIFSQGNKVIKETTNLLSSDRTKFGAGTSAQKEKELCEDIRVFTIKYDLLGFREVPYSRRRANIPKDTLLGELREKLPTITKDDVFTDENYYRFEETIDFQKPLYSFSHNCNLNICLISSDQWMIWKKNHQSD